ncbi:MAG: tetratricopeptide repeat protein [Gammaproteobacteria bacterium]
MIEHTVSGNADGVEKHDTGFHVTEINEHNVQDVLQDSLHKPLVLFCGSAQSPDSEKGLSTLKRVLSRFGGRIAMVTLDCDAHPMIAQQLGALRPPVAKLIAQGQILAELTGLEPEDQLLRLFTQLGGEPGEEVLESTDGSDAAPDQLDQVLRTVEQAILAGNTTAAEQMLRQALSEADAEMAPRLRVRLARLLVLLDRLDDASVENEQLPETSVARAEVTALLFFARERQALAPVEALTQRCAADAADHEARFGLAVYAALGQDFDAAKEHLFQLMTVAQHYRDDIAQKALIALVDVMGSEHPDAKHIRRRLFALLH